MMATKGPDRLGLVLAFFCCWLYQIPRSCTLARPTTTWATRDSTNDASDNKVCYPQIGCFSLGPPWTGFWRTAIPQSPEHVGIEFNLITRNTENRSINECKVNTTNTGVPTLKSLRKLDYRNKRQTTIVHIHGQYYSRKMKLSALKELTTAYLSKRDVNVILVQWNSHIRRGYRQNVSNTRVVAAVAARFIRTLYKLSDPVRNRFHLVGNSLGAHIAGYIGKIIPNTIDRITALEAAQPGFENNDPKTRLHHTDAHYVDALHTNARSFAVSLGLGYVSPLGHADFYFNGGTLQPACFKHRGPEVESWAWNIRKTILQTFEDFVQCSHMMVGEYWKEALQSKCVMWGRPVREKPTNSTVPQTRELTKMTNDITKWTWDDDQACASVDGECAPVGWRTFDTKVRGVFHVKTNSRRPYCIWDS